MVLAWLFTIPLAATFGAAAELTASRIGGLPGVITTATIAVAIFTTIYLLSRRTPITAENVSAPLPQGATHALAMALPEAEVSAV